MRLYKQVTNCEFYLDPHQHLIQDESIYCLVSGKWIKPGNYLTPKELKEKWYPKKTKHELKEERKDAEEKLD